MDQYLLFQIQSQKFALSIKVIDRVVRACAIRPLANSSIHVLGMLDLQGTVIPVVTLRTLLGMDGKSMDLSDMMIICNSLDKQLVLLVDGIDNIEACPDKPSAVSSNIPMPFFLDKFVQFKDEVIPVYSIDKILLKIQDLQAVTGERQNEQTTK